MSEQLFDFGSKPERIVLLEELFFFSLKLAQKLLLVDFFGDLHKIGIGELD